MVHTEFIRRFLARWETRQLVAYIPCRKRNFTGRENPAACGEPIGASGVTVGAGLDLGQQAEADLRRMGIPDALMERFRPYLGKRRQDALAALAAAPLTLTDAQCEAVDAAVHGDYIRRAAALYDRDSAGLPFANVPPQAQAVIVSLFYQLGAPSGYPKTWKYLCAGDWARAARELQTGFKRYANRRADEGRLLAEVA
ncbi:pesticin C-terminus-like muramidase [Desulfovibrio sp. ZJ369]|uniref:pesticin C-terminus-like muramidase n=1 Tax=Desulfovibrio sp. ZJ369 TaxID=2709793 RepID=UPI0013EDEA8B|nr:pesticin C-terminus-like muramidase [Desulfovibrio sp. ZJ369]